MEESGIRRSTKIVNSMDWLTVFLYLSLVIIGWVNIYAAVYDPETQKSIFDLSINSGKQLLWISTAMILVIIIMLADFKLLDTFSLVIYFGLIAVLIGVLFFGVEVAGSKSWFKLGSIRIQPSEFAKFAVALALSKYLSQPERNAGKFRHILTLLGIIALPAGLIIWQGDTGSALVYGSLVIMLYREGLPGIFMAMGLFLVFLFVTTLFFREAYLTELVIVLGTIGLILAFLQRKKRITALIIVGITVVSIGFCTSVDYILSEVMRPHQRKRIESMINPSMDRHGIGYQTWQSKIAIGSGGFAGKGFLQGTQTKFKFVPEQSTDFIFCTIGEEYGWLGTMTVVTLFTVLLFRIIFLAERQKSRFSRVYGYCVASILFFHFMINIGMTIGLFPVIGIPLPFMSYGGSSLWSFTILLFIMIKLDAHRMQVLGRKV